MIRSSRVMPALLTRMSTLPKASSVALTSPSAASGSVTSPWNGSARRPSARIAAAVSSAAGGVPPGVEGDPGAGMGRPLDGGRARGEAGPEGDDADVVTHRDAPGVDRLGERDRHGRGRGVAVA